jgi:hypothetical protein
VTDHAKVPLSVSSSPSAIPPAVLLNTPMQPQRLTVLFTPIAAYCSGIKKWNRSRISEATFKLCLYPISTPNSPLHPTRNELRLGGRLKETYPHSNITSASKSQRGAAR